MARAVAQLPRHRVADPEAKQAPRRRDGDAPLDAGGAPRIRRPVGGPSHECTVQLFIFQQTLWEELQLRRRSIAPIFLSSKTRTQPVEPTV